MIFNHGKLNPSPGQQFIFTRQLLQRIGILLLIYFFLRAIFFIINKSEFQDVKFPAIIFFIEWLYRKTVRTRGTHGFNLSWQLVIFFTIIPLAIVLARGGLQKIPLSPVQASQYVNTSLIPLTTNSPFTFLYSVQHRK